MKTSCCSTDSKMPHYCCHLRNKVEIIDRIPDIPPYIYNRLGDVPQKVPLPLESEPPPNNNGFLGQADFISRMASRLAHPCVQQTDRLCYIRNNRLHFTLYTTHTHPFNGTFSGATQVSRYQKGKPNLDFTEARDSEWQWHQLGHMQVCTTPAPHHCFLQAGCTSCRPTNSIKALKANYTIHDHVAENATPFLPLPRLHRMTTDF